MGRLFSSLLLSLQHGEWPALFSLLPLVSLEYCCLLRPFALTFLLPPLNRSIQGHRSHTSAFLSRFPTTSKLPCLSSSSFFYRSPFPFASYPYLAFEYHKLRSCIVGACQLIASYNSLARDEDVDSRLSNPLLHQTRAAKVAVFPLFFVSPPSYPYKSGPFSLPRFTPF